MRTFIQADMEIRKLGQNIQVARKRRQLTLVELSAKSAVSKTVLRRIEGGDPTVGIGKVFNVLDALGLLKDISEVANPELDRVQVFKEIKKLRESKISSKAPSSAKRFVATYTR